MSCTQSSNYQKFGGLTRLYRIPDFIILDIEAVALMLISNSVRQARTKRDADIEALRAATTKAELALLQAENDLLRQRLRTLEAALARQESAAKSAQTKAIRVIARLKEKNEVRRSQLRQMYDWYNHEITNAGGLTFKQLV